MKNGLLFLLFFLYARLVAGHTNDKPSQFDSLNRELTRAQSDTTRVLIWEKMIWVAPDNKKAVEYGRQGWNLAKRIRFDKGTILCGNTLAFKLIEIDYYRAIPILMETKQTCERTNNQYELVRTLAFLGYAYNKFDSEKAIQYYRQCKKLMLKTGLSEDVVPINMAIGFAFKDAGYADSALVYLQKGYQYALKSPGMIKPNEFYVHFGDVYYKKGQKDLAMSYFRRSIATAGDGPNGQAYQGIALIYRDRHQLDSARLYAKEALRIQQKRMRTIYIIQAANLLFELYQQSNPTAALQYHLLASATKDSLFNQEKAQQVEKLAFDEREGEAQVKRRIEANRLAYQNRVKIYALSGLLLGLVLLALFLYRNSQNKQRANNLLHRQKQEIDRQRANLEKTLLELQTSRQQLEDKNHDLEIEAALEKVRSRSLAMQTSTELQAIVTVVFEKLKELGLVFDGGAGIQLFTENSRDSVLWVAAANQIATPSRINLPYDADDFIDNPIIVDVWKAKETGEAIYNKTYTYEEKNRYFEYVFKHNDLIQIPQFVRDGIRQTPSYTQAFVTEKNSGVIANSWSGEVFPPDKFDIFKRIAKVFDQAYIRFLDLQKAEVQVREAQIEVALERVRSRTMAMQHSTDLADTASVLFQQIKDLGFETWSCGFCTWQKDDIVEVWMGADSGNLLPPMMIPYRKEPTHHDIFNASLQGESVHQKVWRGEALEKHYAFLRTIPSVAIAIKQLEDAGLSLPIIQCYNVGFFKQGYLLLITKETNAELYDLTKRFAAVFEQTYTRFLDLQKAEAQAEQARLDLILIQTEKKRAEDALGELRITQNQLIQKEKLASLGELTAGIAHEIQNPLNFVNNFSEVSTELIEELKEEMQAGRTDDVLALAGDLSRNLQKISHHGGRASAIVKGMLEHARTGTGEKRPTDLNALADEYLKIAYQGLRAKDKDFNCDLITDFDPAIGKVEMMPQEIGRVLLNLYNNAFYAVQQRQKQETGIYQPTVTVNTRLVSRSPERALSLAHPNGVGTNGVGTHATGLIEIRVNDNGMGIPDAIKTRIFQPFFTTKPTGEGTGLGLSLSYDIVIKGHGGTITVKSTAGEGTGFTVTLPI